jgi:hypothetical protein
MHCSIALANYKIIIFVKLYMADCMGLNIIIIIICGFSFDVRGIGAEVGRHWNDGSLGARARFEEKAQPLPLLWIEDLRDEDRGTYRCRIDFKHAPTKNFKINVEVIGKQTRLEIIPLIKSLEKKKFQDSYFRDSQLNKNIHTIPFPRQQNLLCYKKYD